MERAAVPTVTEQHAHGIVTLCDVPRDIEDLIRHALSIVRPARCQLGIPYALSVDLDGIQTQCGDVEPRRLHRPRDIEFPPERRHRDPPGTATHRRSRNPPCAPVFRVQQAHLEIRRFAPRTRQAIAVVGANLPPRALPGGERITLVFDIRRLVGFHAATVPQIRLVTLQRCTVATD